MEINNRSLVKLFFAILVILISTRTIACPDGYQCAPPEFTEWRYGAWQMPGGSYASSEEQVINNVSAQLASTHCNLTFHPGNGSYTMGGDPDYLCKGGITGVVLGIEPFSCKTKIDIFKYAELNDCRSQKQDSGLLIYRERDVYCPEGYGPYQNTFCIRSELPEISLGGPSVTKSLPSRTGPTLQFVEVTRGGVPARGIPVRIQMQEEGTTTMSSTGGVTDYDGIFQYKYIPPYLKGLNVLIRAFCDGCKNTAQKQIKVLMDDGYIDEPQMCIR